MRIAQIAPVWYPIPPTGYGGIELVVSQLTEGLVKQGHDVTLFATGESRTDAKLSYVFDEAPSEKIGQVFPDLYHALHAYERAEEFDIIHDHSGKIGPGLGFFSPTPVLHTLHGPATEDAKTLYKALSKKIYFNAISNYQRECYGDLNFVGTIYNAVDLDAYQYNSKKDGYLLFLGRMSPQKGAHVAVQVANKLNKKLFLVTKITEQHEKKYFEEQVKPFLGKNSEVVGEVDLKTKIDFYRHAECTLFPIQWPEPFGLVMIESMAVGTPVVAIRNGAVPEVIVDKKTGFIVNDSVDEMVEAVKKVGSIDPNDCREHVEKHFSTKRMISDYEKAYEHILELEKSKKL
ncbi:glycosyltransferase family 4 protein [Candidatus Oleimmundimicrobium sp.]|uniref:glycosyltransferase family 4 protein n=1 Tax=Candidatus Oleimmundimicrobium sp. TaxID=3060597 RepID=UPI002725C11C|nr:glycosyltransferase family 4 protein [Candidatus Oleimmundimicrobium sp.]MDO8886489.1 glycosyltransferase family 4 protein [Candidatus Oleimmundimicrobium sp.]